MSQPIPRVVPKAPVARSCRWVSLACIVLLASTSCDPDLDRERRQAPRMMAR
jgi:hypothetical protein